MNRRNSWRTYCTKPVEDLQEGLRVHRPYGDPNRKGTIQSVDAQTGMIRVWWDGEPRPGHGLTEATNCGNIVIESLT